MVDRYWREIETVENDIENAMQISSILLKLKGYDNDLSKIDDNENNISSNLGKINRHSTTISSNFRQTTRNANTISSNSTQINTNTSDISTNLRKIDDNINAIKLINKNSQDNSKDISTNSNLINSNTKSISTNLEKIDNFTQYILQSGKDFEEKYTIEKQIFKFNKDKHFYTLFEKEIEFEFTKNSLLFVKNNMYYKYDDLSDDYHRLQHEYNIYDGDNLIHKYLFNKDTYYDESLDPILHTNEDFCICFKKNYNKIKINLQLHRHNRHGAGNINLEIDDESYINIDYLDRNNDEQVDTNTKDISSNLGKINTNVTDISSNLGKIDGNINAIKLINKNSQDNSNDISNNKGLISANTSSISSNLNKINNITKTIMLKNIYFTDFDSKIDEPIIKELIFLDKNTSRDRSKEILKTNLEYYFKKDDFIEIDCKLMIQHSTYDHANLVFINYNIYDGEIDANKGLFREIRRYNQFPVMNTKNRILAYTKLCYKFKHDVNNIAILINIVSATRKIDLVLHHYIVEYGTNYISIKHYGKS